MYDQVVAYDAIDSLADGRMRRLERPEQIELRKRDRAVGERVRRDPRVLASLLLAAAQPLQSG